MKMCLAIQAQAALQRGQVAAMADFQVICHERTGALYAFVDCSEMKPNFLFWSGERTWCVWLIASVMAWAVGSIPMLADDARV